MSSSLLLLVALAFAVFVVFVFVLVSRNKQGGASIAFPYRRSKTLFSAAERSFLGVLDQAVGPDHRVFGKVRVADIASVEAGLSNSARQGALNRIAAKHFDYVVCRASDLSVVCVVELNDKSHASQRAQARDDFLAKVCQTVNLPLLTFSAKQSYSLQEVRTQFMAVVAPPVGRVGAA